MSRKILCLIFSVLVIFSLAACGAAAPSAAPTAAPTATPTAAPTETPAPTPTAAPETEPPAPAVEADETYTATTASSFNGALTVKIGVTDGVVVSAEISAEEPSLGGPMMKQYESAIVEIGSADMDAIDALSGATTQFTRDAIHTALNDCFTQAGLSAAG